jgi:hypothetical protein
MTNLSDFLPDLAPPSPPVPGREIICTDKIFAVAIDAAARAREERPDIPVWILPQNSENTRFKVEREAVAA